MYRVDRNGDAEFHSIGRDIESGKVTFYLSNATGFAVLALYILKMLLYSHKRKWLDLGEEGAAAISGCIARIAARHKSGAVHDKR